MNWRDWILAADDLPREAVETPEWPAVPGGKVWVRTLTGTERDAFEASLQAPPGVRMTQAQRLANFRARLLVLAVCDEEGSRIFTDVDVAALGKKSAKVLDRLTDVALRLSGLSKKAAEEAEGNSPVALNGASTSDSPSPSA